MKKILAYPFSLITYFLFLFFLCLFHPIQWICLKAGGYEAHKKSVDLLNFFLIHTLYPIFSGFEIQNRELIPEGQPLIFASNHQGVYDIIGVAWLLRMFHPKYVSKIELSKGIPSVSFNLKYGGSVVIDRKDPKQALPVLKKMGEYIETNRRSVLIFPEGTRTKNGKPKAFAPNGLKILCKYAPSAYVVPITINNSWKVFRYGNFPLGMGNRITFTVHPPLKVSDYDYNTLFEKTEQAVVSGIRID